MADAHLLLSFARLMTAALAGTIAVLGFRAYARTRRRTMLMMASGAALLAAGYFVEGLLVELARWSIEDATVLESVFTLIASALLVASVFLTDARPPTRDPRRGHLAIPPVSPR